MLDGTPVLDIKPYVPYADAFPDARAGWLDDIERDAFTVVWSEKAAIQNAQLARFDAELRSIVDPLLQVDPFPHPYRRITALQDGYYSMACRSWRIAFSIDDRTIHIHGIESGYTREQVATAPAGTLHQQEAHEEWHRDNPPI
jgi:hypothetical protein